MAPLKTSGSCSWVVIDFFKTQTKKRNRVIFPISFQITKLLESDRYTFVDRVFEMSFSSLCDVKICNILQNRHILLLCGSCFFWRVLVSNFLPVCLWCPGRSLVVVFGASLSPLVLCVLGTLRKARQVKRWFLAY